MSTRVMPYRSHSKEKARMTNWGFSCWVEAGETTAILDTGGDGATLDDIATFKAGTHPTLTASPIAYQLVNAAEMAIVASWSSVNR